VEENGRLFSENQKKVEQSMTSVYLLLAWHSLCCDVTSSLSFVISGLWKHVALAVTRGTSGGKRETFLRKSEEGGTEHDKCVPSASLMPQDYQALL
jgi:hypothetical protein